MVGGVGVGVGEAGASGAVGIAASVDVPGAGGPLLSGGAGSLQGSVARSDTSSNSKGAAPIVAAPAAGSSAGGGTALLTISALTRQQAASAGGRSNVASSAPVVAAVAAAVTPSSVTPSLPAGAAVHVTATATAADTIGRIAATYSDKPSIGPLFEGKASNADSKVAPLGIGEEDVFATLSEDIAASNIQLQKNRKISSSSALARGKR
jgi:hypothetical protein